MKLKTTRELGYMLEGYDVPAILVTADYEILATNHAYQENFGAVDTEQDPKCFAVSHGYDKPCDQAGEDCPLKAAKASGRREKVLHIHQTRNGREHVDVEMVPIFDDKGDLQFFVELLKPVPLASGKPGDQEIIGHSRAFTEMLSNVTKVAESDASVLLLGESGTGKELISRLVHDASTRREKLLVTLECSGLSETLIESELFGHSKGAFTGAYNDRKGLVEIADGGTLFLDEIGDVSLATQVKLLRLLETKTFRRVGETQVRTSDFRLVCATHRDLKKMVEDGRFRLDLYYRINIFPINLPPLSDRHDDIPDLVYHLLKHVNRKLHITQEAIQLILEMHFPGNIRQLKNLLTRASILAETNIIDGIHLKKAIAMDDGYLRPIPRVEEAGPPLKQNEAVYIDRLLARHEGNKKAVAKALGISLRTLYRKLESE